MHEPTNRVDMSLSIEFERPVLHPKLVADAICRAILQAETTGAGVAPAFQAAPPHLMDAMRPQTVEIRCGEYVKTQPLWELVRDSRLLRPAADTRAIAPHGDELALSDRDVATILAALRYFSANRSADPEVEELFAEYFADVPALDEDEIDVLCERINFSTTVGVLP